MTKDTAVKLLGGECIICGYNKCIQALEFHHTVSEEKEFQLTESNTLRKSDEIVLEELYKCQLLCRRCHTEMHDMLENQAKNDVTDSYYFVKLHMERMRKSLRYAFENKCTICGYERCSRALDFHHMANKEKNDNIGTLIAKNRSREIILAEAEKVY